MSPSVRPGEAFDVVVPITAQQSQAWWAGARNAAWNMHYDVGFARKMGFADLLISAPHLTALASDLLHHHYGDAWARNGALEMEFKGTVIAGDTVVVAARVSDAAAAGPGTRVEVAVTITKVIDGAAADRAACTGVATVVVGPSH